MRAIFAAWRHDPFCGTGDPWVSFSNRQHAPELLALLSTWALETTADDRGVALAALAHQNAESLTPMWRLLAEEPGAPFGLQVVWGLLGTGGDAEVPAALRVLEKLDDQALVLVAKHSRRTRSASKLSNHLSLMLRLRPGQGFRKRESFLPASETWSELVRAEPAFVACAAKLGKASETRDPEVRLELTVDEHGKVMSVETTVWNGSASERNRCVENVAQKLKFLPATASAFPGEPGRSELVLRVTPAGIE